MRFLKLFITVFAMAIAMNVSAQSKTTAKAKTTTTTTTTKAKSTTTAPAKKATAAKSTATTTAKSTATTTTASKPAATTTTPKTATASASKPAKKASASFASKDYDPGYHMMVEAKVGSFYGTGGFGANVALEHEFHKYLAWDLFSVDFSMPFNANFLSVGLKTGIRGFSPYFYDKLKMRAYSSLAVGYDCGITVDSGLRNLNEWAGVSNTSHGFALSWGIGVQMINHLYVGYDLEYSTVWKSTAHYAKFAWRF